MRKLTGIRRRRRRSRNRLFGRLFDAEARLLRRVLTVGAGRCGLIGRIEPHGGTPAAAAGGAAGAATGVGRSARRKTEEARAFAQYSIAATRALGPTQGTAQTTADITLQSQGLAKTNLTIKFVPLSLLPRNIIFSSEQLSFDVDLLPLEGRATFNQLERLLFFVRSLRAIEKEDIFNLLKLERQSR